MMGCPPTHPPRAGACRELGRWEREALQRRAEVAREGFRIKQQLVQEAAAGRLEKQVPGGGGGDTWGGPRGV